MPLKSRTHHQTQHRNLKTQHRNLNRNLKQIRFLQKNSTKPHIAVNKKVNGKHLIKISLSNGDLSHAQPTPANQQGVTLSPQRQLALMGQGECKTCKEVKFMMVKGPQQYHTFDTNLKLCQKGMMLLKSSTYRKRTQKPQISQSPSTI